MSTLIVYSSKYGSTEKCANLVAKELGGQTELVDLKNAKQMDLTKYDSVIIGGSIYAGRIRKEVTKFCADNLNSLKGKKLGLYICAMSGGEAAEKALTDNYPSELLAQAKAKDWLGGEFQIDKMGLISKFIVKKLSKVTTNTSNIQNDRIKAFANNMKL